jgi:tRNA(Arg) A34 adenosine deaminase TadA
MGTGRDDRAPMVTRSGPVQQGPSHHPPVGPVACRRDNRFASPSGVFMDSNKISVTFELPEWVRAFSRGYRPGAGLADRMDFVIGAAAENLARGTGGPFAAAVFEHHSGRLVSVGVNLVTTQKLSILHAEIVALCLAQRALGTYDLAAEGLPAYELVTTTEPCAMCLGAIPWSGIRHLVTGARDEDARAIGFDEGPKVPDWIEALEARGIAVTTGTRRKAARDVLLAYHEAGGVIYNPRTRGASNTK